MASSHNVDLETTSFLTNSCKVLKMSQPKIKDKVLKNNEDFVWATEVPLTGKFIIDVEFLDLKTASPNAIIKRLMTDVPFDVLDSSLVASITSRYLANTKAVEQWGSKLHLFCVGLEYGSPDLKAAKEVADYLGTVHHEFHFTVQVDHHDSDNISLLRFNALWEA